MPLSPLPPPFPTVFAGVLAFVGLLASIEAGRNLRARTPNPSATQVAGGFLVLAAVHLLECAFSSSAWVRLAPHLHSATFGLAYGFGPAIWLVARRTARRGPGRVPRWIHFLPVLVGATSLAAWFRTPAAGKLAYFEFLANARPRSMGFGGMVGAQTLILIGVLYSAAAERVLRERSREDGTDEDTRTRPGKTRRGREDWAQCLRRIPADLSGRASTGLGTRFSWNTCPA